MKAAAAALAIVLVFSASAIADGGSRLITSPEGLRWMPGPSSLPKGIEISVLAGDPRSSGPYVLRARIPDATTLAPHWHTQAENLTVLEGSLAVGDGSRFDETRFRVLRPGGFVSLPPRTPHFNRAQGNTVIQLTGMGPFDINYVNAQDDPRLRSASR